MKEIKAFIKPNRVENVVAALQEAGHESVTLSKGGSCPESVSRVA